jgi:Clostripain family
MQHLRFKPIFLLFILLFQFTIVFLQQNGNFSFVPHLSEAYSVANSKGKSFTTNPSNSLSDYTLLVYMIGSDLQAAATKNILQMENPGSSSKVNVIVETGGGSNLTKIDGTRFIDFTKVQRHKILHNDIQTIANLGQKDMGNPKTLSDFIVWGMSSFPAKKYAIILWDHGSGLNGFGQDLVFNNDILTPNELKIAFLTAKVNTNETFELIGFDACAMSSLEVASRLQNAAHYMVSSEEVEPPWGWNYTSIIQNLSASSEQSGNSLGTAIVDSYFRQSKHFSAFEKFGADKETTLAVIDMTKIPQLIKDVKTLSNALVSNINDLPSAISLSKSIDLTEHYGQSARGSSGFVDLYDLLLNIQGKYPSLSDKIKAVQNSSKAATIYKVNGEARPNANGLSVYMPLLKNEYSNSTELFVVGLDWLKLLYSQRSMITTDKQPPIIKSIREGNVVKASVYGSDLANIYAQIVTNSSKDHNLMYLQSIEPSLIDNKGYFQYKQHSILVVCNETKCVPASMKFEVNRDKKFAFIPVRLESSKGNLDVDVSLIYEIGKDGKFAFLGARPEIDPQTTIPKEKFSLMSGDKIFFKALPSRAQLQSVGDISGRELSNSILFEDLKGPLLVNNPEKIEPRYINSTSPFAISFTMCDYSDNCDKTRWYSFNNRERAPVLPHDLEFGYDLLAKNTSTFSQAGSNFYTYVNPTFGFKLQYPSDWIEKRPNIYDNSSSSDDTFADPAVVSFLPSKPFSSGGNLPTSLSISVTDWPFKESPKYYFDFFNNTYNQKKALANNVQITYSNATMIAGNSAFKFIFKYTSIPEQSLRTAKEQRIEEAVSILMNNRMYTIDFASYSSQFYRYLPQVERIVNSFGPYLNQYNNINSSIYNYVNKSSNVPIYNQDTLHKINNDSKVKKESNPSQNIINNTQFLIYSDPVYRYKIKYPFYPGIGVPASLKNANPNLRGELFTLNANATKSADVSNSVNLMVTSFLKNETRPIRQNPIIILDSSGLRTFDIGSIISNVNSRLSFLKSAFINFAVLNKSGINFKNHPAYSIEYSYFNPIYKSPMREKVIFTIIDDQMFVFEYSAKPSNYYTYMPTLQKVINSFELEAKPPPISKR